MTNYIPDFPRGICNTEQKEDGNPAIQLFGRRFSSEQHPVELLSEFLLLLSSQKAIAGDNFSGYFPAWEKLQEWAYEELSYSPKARLNLKLFTFLGASRLETRHATHRQHCQELWKKMKEKIYADDGQKDEALILLNNLFLGFWGNGAQRTWCAQNFLPFCEGVLSGELIWNETVARKSEKLLCWQDVLDNFNSLFTQNQHRFLARGGELLFLQLNNAFHQEPVKITTWLKDTGRWEFLLPHEQAPKMLYDKLQGALYKFFEKTPKELNELADFIDRQADQSTANATDSIHDRQRQITCGWCPEEGWHEGYLFAIELLRILQAQTDLMETVDLLQMVCAMQLMRSLAAQSYRYRDGVSCGDGLNFRLFFSEIDESCRKRREISQNTLSDICLSIYKAIRIPQIKENISTLDGKQERVYKEADKTYGHKLYSRVGKSIGLIVPRRGGKARFVLTDKLLRFFVLSLVPTQRMTLERFKQNIANHFGFVFDESALAESPDWQNRKEQLDFNAVDSQFLERMLEASGMLITLSDSCSLVKNPFCRGGK
ncbi:hypothetical protein [Victivallis sp. Marseille-Q1083]|uniref:hypothetical protein n=1 Tax=Victivallis sp. Marseille-Q1083 TaxID=2717288 RepID=UPI00158BA0E6|nr:hypothetical protein [Victivallis sp. Marseille-Q1083]